MGLFSEILPVAGGLIGGLVGGAPGAAVGGLIGSAGQRAMGGGILTGSPATPSRKGALPSTAEGRRLLGMLQEEVLRAKPTNLNVNGVSIPIMPPFLRQKARTAQQLTAGEVGGTTANGGLLSSLAEPLGMAANLYESERQEPTDGMVGSWRDFLKVDGPDKDTWWR